MPEVLQQMLNYVIAIYIRLSAEDGDLSDEKSESNSVVNMVSGKVSAEDYQHKRGQCEKHIQRLEIKIKELEDAKRQAKVEELSADSILPYTNVRTLTRELVDLLIQNIYIYSSTSIEIVWKCGDEYQRLLADTTKKEAAEHEQG